MTTAERPGDLLLFAVTAWRHAPRDQLRHACDWLSTAPIGSEPPADGQVPALARHTRAAAVRALAALGHCDPASEGGLSIRPPHLAELPAAGAPQALVCGARTPTTGQDAAAAAARAGARLQVSEQPLPLAPARLLLTAPSRTSLRSAAAALGMEYHPTPAAWAALASDQQTLQTAQEQLVWRTGAELNWPRRDFDTASCTFRDPADADTGNWRLSSYLDPVTHQPRHALWRGDRTASTDRDWGRYLSLYHRRRTVLEYFPQSRVAWLPTTAPLPLPLARALTLCTGLLPRSVVHSGIGQVRARDVHHGVPPDVYAEVARRLAPNR